MLEKIKEYIESRSQIHDANLKKQEDILKYIIEYTNDINKELTYKEMLFLTYNEYKEYPKCKICNEDTRFQKNKFLETCSRECGYKIAGKKMKATKLEKYGCVNQCTKEYMLEKYGVENSSQLPGVGDKISKSKQLKTKEENEQINNKRKNTVLEKYGVEYYTKTKECQDKRKQTCLEKYGVESTLQLDSVRNKRIEECKRTSYRNYILKNTFAKPLFSEEEYITSKTDKFKFICFKCNNDYIARYDDGHITSLCPHCYPKNSGYSKIEKNLMEWIKTITDFEIKENVRNLNIPSKKRNCEIDIFIPRINLGIEVNGLYWHSNNRNYHQEKYISAKNKNINLLTITDYDWINKNKIWKSIIKNKLNLINYKLMARKCTIKEIDNKLKNVFLNKYHIQGEDKSNIKLGLFYKERLVAVMTFGKKRFENTEGYELIRYCTISNFKIMGGASKLLTYFERNFNPKSLVSYANCNYSIGNLYKNLGFEFKHISSPNYFWWNKNNILSRYQTQKHKLINILDNFDESLSESENMLKNGWNRYFDCGNLVFTKEY